MVAAATVPVQDYLTAFDVLLKADKAIAPAMLTGRRNPERDRRVGQRHADDITLARPGAPSWSHVSFFVPQACHLGMEGFRVWCRSRSVKWILLVSRVNDHRRVRFDPSVIEQSVR